MVKVPRDVEGLAKGSARRARAAKERQRVFAPGPARHSRRGRRGVARAAPAQRGRALPVPLHRTRAARLPAAGPQGARPVRTANSGARARGLRAPCPQSGGRAEGGLRPVSSRPTRAHPNSRSFVPRRGHRRALMAGAAAASRGGVSAAAAGVPCQRGSGRGQDAGRWRRAPPRAPRAPFSGSGCSLQKQCHFFMNESGPGA